MRTERAVHSKTAARRPATAAKEVRSAPATGHCNSIALGPIDFAVNRAATPLKFISCSNACRASRGVGGGVFIGRLIVLVVLLIGGLMTPGLQAQRNRPPLSAAPRSNDRLRNPDCHQFARFNLAR